MSEAVNRVDIAKVFEDGSAIDAALAEATRRARLEHRLLGYPLVVWQDGRVVLIPPEQIAVDP